MTGLPITILFGVLVRQELVGSQKLGKISETALFLAEIPKNIKYIINSSFEASDLQIKESKQKINLEINSKLNKLSASIYFELTKNINK